MRTTMVRRSPASAGEGRDSIKTRVKSRDFGVKGGVK